MLFLAASACSMPAGGTGDGVPGGTLSQDKFSGGTAARAPQAPAGPTAPAESAPAGDGGTGIPGIKSTVETALKAVAGAGSPPSTDIIRTALTDAGIPAKAVEVTAGRTPTGLAADAVEVAVRDGGSCFVAQIRSGSVVLRVLPVLASGGCLVGFRD